MAYQAPTPEKIMQGLEKVRSRAEAAFKEVSHQFPQAVSCKPGCDDCCHALFDLSPIESWAIALGFLGLPRALRRDIQRRSKKAARAFDAAVNQAFKLQGEERLASLSKARIACPLLDKGHCALYEERPITCRLYGIPVAIGGRARTCRLADFQPGRTYPTVDMERLLRELEPLSNWAVTQMPELQKGRRDVARTIELAQNSA